MTIIEQRACKIGTKIEINRQKHGDEVVPALYFKLKEIMLNKDELNALVDSTTAWDDMFCTGNTGVEPKHKRLEPERTIDEKFEDAQVIVTVGLKNDQIALVNCTLTKVKLTPLVGGLTEMTLTVQTVESVDQADQLKSHIDSIQSVSIDFGETPVVVDDQPELPLHVGEPARSRRRVGSNLTIDV